MTTIVEREDQPYVALRGKVAMNEIGDSPDRTPELFGWLAARTSTRSATCSSSTTWSTWRTGS